MAVGEEEIGTSVSGVLKFWPSFFVKGGYFCISIKDLLYCAVNKRACYV